MSLRITKTYVDKVTPPPFNKNGSAKQKIHRDSAIIGFGLRITSNGAKSFVVEKKIEGKSKRKTLGAYGPLTVEQARKEAMKFLGKVATGTNPIKEEKEKNIRSTTLQEAFNDYILTRKDLKPYTIKDYTRSIQTLLKKWLNKPLTEISKDMVEMKHRELGKNSHARANNAMRVLRAIFNHAIAKYENADGTPIFLFNPVNRLSEVRAWYKITPRQTLIKPTQLQAWYEATLLLNNETTRDYLHLVLFTGLRRGEASRLEWEYIDFNEKTLTVPETKNGQIHTLPLSDFLYSLLKRRESDKTSPFVFPTNGRTGYLTEPKTATARVSELSGVKFSMHDLRRTFITIAESLEISAYALKRLINHKDPNDVTANYIISDTNRLRKPMQEVTNFIKEHFNLL